MKKAIVLAANFLFGISILLFSTGIASALPLVESSGWIRFDYSFTPSVTTTPSQYIDVQAGYDLSGSPYWDAHDSATPEAHAYVATPTTHSWAEGTGDIDNNYLRGEVYASADGSTPGSWAYCDNFYKAINFHLDSAQTIEIGYTITGNLSGQSSSSVGSIYTAAAFSIQIDGITDDQGLYHVDEYAEVTLNGIGTNSLDLSSLAAFSGTLSVDFEAGDHTIILAPDIYASAAVPEPATIMLFLLGVVGLMGIKRLT